VSNQKVTQAVLVSQSAMNPHQGTEQFALFDASGTSLPLTADTGATVVLTGYTIQSAAAVAATDTVNHAIGKLEARIVALESA
jgi:hypothetical protein